MGGPDLVRAKAGDNYTPVGDFIDPEGRHDSEWNLKLTVNGKETFTASTGMMIYSIEKLIAFTSTYMTLNEGDLIMTGTPFATSSVKAGDHLSGELYQKGELLDKFNFRLNNGSRMLHSENKA